MIREDIINELHYCGDFLAVERLLNVLPESVKEDIKQLLQIPEGSTCGDIETAKEINLQCTSLKKEISNKTYKKINDTYKISKWSLIVSIISLFVGIAGLVLGILSLLK